jgi:hypothetical protein
MWLRMLEIGAGLIILILGVAAFYPWVDWGWATFTAFLAVAPIILENAYILRIFAKGISGRRRLNLVLSVLATLIAVLVIALSFYGFYLALLYLLALGLLFSGITSAARGTVGGKNRGHLWHLRGHHRFTVPKNSGHPRHFHRPRRVNVPRSRLLPRKAAALVTLSLMLFGLEPIISGIMCRWI